MRLNPVGAAIPFFFLLIGVELFVAWRRGRTVYRLNDTLTDLGCGMGDQLIGLFVKGSMFAGYVLLYENAAIFELSTQVAWVVGFLGVDLGYYWYHRFSHRTAFGWATHVVHHQSEEYNLAVALRQSWFTKFYSWLFYLPLAVLGVSPAIYAANSAINLLYQFWIHTRLIGKLGFVEWVLNTPSHHRVHHGTNPEYLDKNYAGVLIIWDRIFGTFEVEQAEVVYGTLKPLRSWNPLWANVGPLLKLARDTVRGPRLWDAIRAPLMPPGWTPPSLPAVALTFPAPGRGYDANRAPGLTAYLTVNFVPVAAIVTGLLLFRPGQPMLVNVVGTALVFASCIAWAGLFEGRAWARPLEYARLVAGAGLAVGSAVAGHIGIGVAGAVVVGLIASLIWFAVVPVEAAPD